MKKTVTTYLLLILIGMVPLLARGTTETEVTENRKPTIAVSIVPQQYVVDQIASTFVDTVVLVGPGQNPHSYEPTPRQMATLSQADVWITSGTDFETALIPKISSMYPDLFVIDGTAGVKFRYLEEHDHEDEVEELNEDEHDNEGNLDRHSWLGKEPMKIMARHITDALVTIDSEHATTYRNNLQLFLSQVDDLFAQMGNELAPLAGSSVLVYHPSFGYLLDEFGINQKAVETGGKEPTARNLSMLISEAKEADVPAIFVQAQFPVNAAQSIADSIGAIVLPLDPLAYDWIENMRLIGETLKRSLIKDGGSQ
jgi:zinc transport system substrate-binding protein